jgi:glycosyltransferase involved in cell wall biosynthesis
VSIVVLTESPFPFGLGATSRILSYSRGFVEAGREVSVFVTRATAPVFPGPPDTQLTGTYDGVHYSNCSGRFVRPSGRMRRSIAALTGVVRTIRAVRTVHAKNPIGCLVLVSNSALEIGCFFVLSRVLGVPYVQEKSEYPFAGRRQGRLGRWYARMYADLVYKSFDGIFVMTEALREYFEPRVRRTAKLLVVPMTVEVDRFSECDRASPIGGPYVAYCGDMSGTKDGVDVLIDAFSRVAAEHPEVRLVLVGDASDPDESDRLRAQVRSSALTDRVLFTGRLARDEMPAVLCGATVLALARPANRQAQGGFPTKLGEYLATGNPVVATRVGELDRYLTDETNVFFATPDDAESFASKLDLALSDPVRARSIGSAGQGVARSAFDYRRQSRRLLAFLDGLAGDRDQ